MSSVAYRLTSNARAIGGGADGSGDSAGSGSGGAVVLGAVVDGVVVSGGAAVQPASTAATTTQITNFADKPTPPVRQRCHPTVLDFSSAT